MRLSVIKTIEELRSLRPQWDALLESSQNNVVQLTHDWIIAWWDSFGNEKTPHIITVYDDNGLLLGIAPLASGMCSYRGVNINKISLMANGQSPSADIIIRGDNHELVIRELLAYLSTLKGWDLLEINKLNKDGKTSVRLSKYLTENRILFGIKNNIESPFIEIAGDWETFFGTKSKKFKKSLRNKINKAEKVGDISIERVQIKDAMDPNIKTMVEISSKSWKKDIGNDMLGNPRINNFYKKICASLGEKGAITLWLLKKEGKPVAFEFHINYRGVVYPVRADYDDAFGDLSPGSVLEYNILKTLFEEGRHREYNTCGHTYDYLTNWSTDTKKHINFEIFRRQYKSYALYFMEYLGIPLLKRLRVDRNRDYVKKGATR